jgi:hypothetical protein
MHYNTDTSRSLPVNGQLGSSSAYGRPELTHNDDVAWQFQGGAA